MFLADAIEDYLRHITYEQGLAENTRLTYQANLRRFLTWLESNGHPQPQLDAYSEPTLRRYLYAIGGQKLRPRSVRGLFHPLRGLGNYLQVMGVFEENPAMKIRLPKKDAAVKRSVTDEEVLALFDACYRHRKPRTVALYRGILSILVYAGLRRAEVCALKVGDIDLKEKSVLVRSGKGRKSRMVYLPDEAIVNLREWLNFRETDCQGDWLFLHDRQRRVNEDGLGAILETIKSLAGLADHDNIKPHAIRRFYGTHLLRQGANLRDIQAAYGHNQLSTTSEYLDSSREQLRNIAHLASLHTQEPAQSQPKHEEGARVPFAERVR